MLNSRPAHPAQAQVPLPRSRRAEPRILTPYSDGFFFDLTLLIASRIGLSSNVAGEEAGLVRVRQAGRPPGLAPDLLPQDPRASPWPDPGCAPRPPGVPLLN